MSCLNHNFEINGLTNTFTEYRKKGTYITTHKDGRSKALVMKSRMGPPSLTTKCSMFLGKTFSAGHGSKRPYSSWLKKKSVCLSKRNTT